MARTPAPRDKIKIKRLAVGDRAFIGGQVLRALDGEGSPLLILLDDVATKIIINAYWVAPEGEIVRGGDAVTLNGTVTRIGESALETAVPISLAIDGYTQAKVTLPARAVGRVS